jgi:transcription initiation factor TFIIIB Brf1 subunit/transcription initiation factor TFIIB
MASFEEEFKKKAAAEETVCASGGLVMKDEALIEAQRGYDAHSDKGHIVCDMCLIFDMSLHPRSAESVLELSDLF